MEQRTADPAGEHHVALLVGTDRSGRDVHEVVPARRLADGTWLVAGTPALAQGCAAGDTLAVDARGAYAVRHRGGNVAVVSYAEAGADVHVQAEALRSSPGPVALVEPDPRGRWLVATVPVSVGFPRIEAALRAWEDATGAPWSYGNVDDEHDVPLGWWVT